MSGFLSFSPAATLAQAVRTMQAARDRMAQFTVPPSTDAPQTQTAKEQEKKEDGTDDSDESEDESESGDESAGDGKSSSLPHPAGDGTAAAVEAAATITTTAAAVAHDTDADTGSRKRKASLLEPSDSASDASSESSSSSSSEMDTSAMESVEATPTTSEAAPMPSPPTTEDASAACLHYVSRGPSFAASSTPGVASLRSFASLESSELLARRYPFTLDDFQQRSVEVLENHQHVLVAAHTSAGKTVVAEYAIAMVFRENARARERQQLQAAGSRAAQQASTLPPTQKRVIFTSPIKALSNQKYREFKDTFGDDVGLLTGDVILNPQAACLVMTTEILRSMLYNGSETIADTTVVIMDEVHYMKDVERGIIWEESIIMMPPSVQFVFLSATLSNAEEFAEWIHEIKAGQIKEAMRHDGGRALAPAADSADDRPAAGLYDSCVCHVVYTNKRPIPLMHYLFLKGGQGIYQIKNDRHDSSPAADAASGVTSRGAINVANFRKIQSEIVSQEQQKQAAKAAFGDLIKQQHTHALESGGASTAFSQRIQDQLAVSRAAKRAEVPDLVRLISLAVEQDWLPIIVFSFSRRECEHLSLTAGDRRWNLDLTSADEKAMIQLVWDRAMEGLQAIDRKLPQLSYLLPLLLRGFAVHHSGLLPILKEVIEILFQEGLVKCLFATETFAMGINVPARSVVFTSLEKFDGRSTRYLHPSEYTQMAGRAGRRGIDTKGLVIMMVGPKDIEASAASNMTRGIEAPAAGDEIGGMIRQILVGTTDPLQSKFRLTYNMILNLIRCSSTFDPTYILANSFLHFQQKHPFRFRRASGAPRNAAEELAAKRAPLTNVSGRRARMGEGGISSLAAAGDTLASPDQQSGIRSSMADLQQTMAELDEQLEALALSHQQCAQILAYQSEYERLQSMQQQQYEFSLRHPLRAILPFLQSGRLVYVRQPAVAATNTTAFSAGKAATPAVEWGWGIVVHWRKRHAGARMEVSEKSTAGDTLPTLFNPAEYVVDVMLPVRLGAATGGDANALTESVQRWGDVIVPLPPTQIDGPRGWENGRWDLQRRETAADDFGKSSSPSPTAPAPLYHILNCSLSMVHTISAVRIYMPPSLLLEPSPQAPAPQSMRHALFTVCEQTMRNFPQMSLPKITPADFSPIERERSDAIFDGTQLRKSWSREEEQMQLVRQQLPLVEHSLRTSPVHSLPLATVQSFLRLHDERSALSTALSSFTSTLTTTHLTSYRIELKTRLRILRRFKHLSSEGLITNKGRIAAEIECTDELLITEFIYEGHWKSLTTPELISVLTALLDVERSNADRLQLPTAPLREAFAHLQGLARNIAEVSNECGLILDASRYVGSFKHDLIPIAYAWVSQPDIPFAQLLTMSTLFEGTLIRIFRRLDELLNQLMKAASTIGELTLFDQLQEGQKLLKKGIMFAGSLYI